MIDSDLQISKVRALVPDDRDAELLKFIRELVTELAKGSVGLCSDEDPLPLGQEMREQIGDGVGLASTGWPLNNSVIAEVDPLDDLALLVVGRQWKIRGTRRAP